MHSWVTPPAVAEMMVVPRSTAVTRPVSSTVALSGSSEIQMISAWLPAGEMVATIWKVSPT